MFFWWLNGEFFRSNRRWNWSLGCWKLSKFTHLLNYKAGLSYFFLFFFYFFYFNFINFLCFFMWVLFIYLCVLVNWCWIFYSEEIRKEKIYFKQYIAHKKEKRKKEANLEIQLFKFHIYFFNFQFSPLALILLQFSPSVSASFSSPNIEMNGGIGWE